jgi:hypothetical protein
MFLIFFNLSQVGIDTECISFVLEQWKDTSAHCDFALKHNERNRGVLQEYFETAFVWIMVKRPLNKSAVFKTRFIRVNDDNCEKNIYGGDDYKHINNNNNNNKNNEDDDNNNN